MGIIAVLCFKMLGNILKRVILRLHRNGVVPRSSEVLRHFSIQHCNSLVLPAFPASVSFPQLHLLGSPHTSLCCSCNLTLWPSHKQASPPPLQQESKLKIPRKQESSSVLQGFKLALWAQIPALHPGTWERLSDSAMDTRPSVQFPWSTQPPADPRPGPDSSW